MDAPWLKYFPQFISDRLIGRPALQSALGNSVWLALDRVLRIIISAMLAVWLARYLGPDRYGQLSYAIGFASLFGAIASLGLSGIVVRELVRLPEEKNVILGSTLMLRFISSAFSFLLSLGAIWLLRPADTLSQWLVGIVAVAMVFQTSEVIELWFQSQLQSRYAVFCKGIVFLSVSSIKIWLILTKAALIAFAWVFMAEFALTAVVLVSVYGAFGNTLRLKLRWLLRTGRLLKQSWALILSNMAVMLYMKLDIVMLREMKGETPAGIYAAATVISEAGYFLPLAIVASAFPVIIKYREQDYAGYLISLKKLYFVLFWLAVIVVLPGSLLSSWIIRFLYGSEFSNAASVLAIHLWASVPVFLGVASDHYLLAESMQIIVFFRSAVGAGMNVILNVLLIPKMGPTGAALATVLSYSFILISLLFLRKTRKHFVFIMSSPFIMKKTSLQ